MFRVVLKSNLKLLLRNKGYLVLLFLLPLLSIILLNSSTSNTKGVDEYQIHELKKDTLHLTNLEAFTTNSKMIIKVYDSANTEESKYFLESLSNSGMYQIYRFASSKMTQKEIKKSATLTANQSNIHAIVSLSADFLVKDTVTVYRVGEDSRFVLLKQHMSQNIKNMKSYMDEQGNIDIPLLKQKTFNKQVIDWEDDNALTSVQQSNIAFSLITMILGFVFTGVCIVAIITYEKEQQILTRILMIPKTSHIYVLVKASVTLCTVVLQCFITMLYYLLFVNIDIGIDVFTYIGLLFGLGLVFNLMSVVIGMFVPYTLYTSYIVFFLWTFTNMISGLYFPGIAVPTLWERLSLLMPQKWMMITSNAIMNQDNKAVLAYIAVIISFLVIMITLGFLGIKIKQKE